MNCETFLLLNFCRLRYIVIIVFCCHFGDLFNFLTSVIDVTTNDDEVLLSTEVMTSELIC